MRQQQSGAHRNGKPISTAQGLLFLGIVILVGLLLVNGGRVINDPWFRLRVLGELGYVSLTSTEVKIDMVNQRTEQPFSVGMGVEILPFSGEQVVLASALPVDLALIRRERLERVNGGYSSREISNTPLPEIEPGVFLYKSARYPIEVLIEVVDVLQGEDAAQRLWMSPEDVGETPWAWLRFRAEATE